MCEPYDPTPHLSMHVVRQHVGNVDVSVEDVVELEVVVILPEGIHQRLAHLQPAHVEQELQDGEDRHVDLETG